MSHKALMTSTLHHLEVEMDLLDKCLRVELKRTTSGWWRLYLAFKPGVTPQHCAPLVEHAQVTGMTCNLFGKGGHVTGCTFVDDQESDTAPPSPMAASETAQPAA